MIENVLFLIGSSFMTFCDGFNVEFHLIIKFITKIFVIEILFFTFEFDQRQTMKKIDWNKNKLRNQFKICIVSFTTTDIYTMFFISVISIMNRIENLMSHRFALTQSRAIPASSMTAPGTFFWLVTFVANARIAASLLLKH